jgi:hypothetical protein
MKKPERDGHAVRMVKMGEIYLEILKERKSYGYLGEIETIRVLLR